MSAKGTVKRIAGEVLGDRHTEAAGAAEERLDGDRKPTEDEIEAEEERVRAEYDEIPGEGDAPPAGTAKAPAHHEQTRPAPPPTPPVSERG